MEALADTALTASDGRTFAQQEILLILLNLFALLSLLVLQTFFRQMTDPFSFDLVALLFVLRILEQTAEVVWLAFRGHTLSTRAVFWYARASIAVNIIFSALLSISANSVDAHYSVLLVLPLIAAGFRLSWLGLAATVICATAVDVFETWVYFLRNPPVDMEEFFEVSSVALIFVVVGSVAWGLARQMRRNSERLQRIIEELRRTQGRLVEEEKLSAVGRLASSVAHEIRNPVSMIASALETVCKVSAPPELRQEFVEIAAKESARLERVTTDFLSYARPRPPEKRPLSALETLDYVAGLIRAKLKGDGPRVELCCPPGLEIHADAFQLHQCLLNLALNALAFTPPEGRIILGGEVQGRGGRLYVQNEGPAIPEDKERDIFEPFFTSRPQGTGLGLSISRNIARAHGGDLELDQNDPGAVRFAVTLPGE